MRGKVTYTLALPWPYTLVVCILAFDAKVLRTKFAFRYHVIVSPEGLVAAFALIARHFFYYRPQAPGRTPYFPSGYLLSVSQLEHSRCDLLIVYLLALPRCNLYV